MPSPTEILPRILILATGGTISGTSDGRSPMGYDAGGLGGDILVNAVPGLAELATLRTEQIANIGSQDMHDDVWASLAERILLACESDEADGFVIIHGTDTMEETAFFLQNVLPHRKPVVLTGAMRPANARSADGTANLFAAVKVAAAPQSIDRGVMMVLNDTIHAARYGSKTHTTDVQTFLSPNAGPLGFVDAASLRFVTPSCPASGGRYRVPDQRPFPKVDIVFAHTGMDTRQIDHAVRDGAKGIILAGVGDGNAAGAVIEALHRARTGGIVVVRASRVMAGWVHRNIELSDDAHGFATSCDLNPQKARILLQLLVAAGEADPLRIQSAFSDMGFHAEL